MIEISEPVKKAWKWSIAGVCIVNLLLVVVLTVLHLLRGTPTIVTIIFIFLVFTSYGVTAVGALSDRWLILAIGTVVTGAFAIGNWIEGLITLIPAGVSGFYSHILKYS